MYRAGRNYDRQAVSIATGVAFDPEEGKTQQQFKDEVDIQTIVRRFGLTGKVPGNLAMPMSGDFTHITDFHDAMNVVRQAQDEFLRVPGELRARFNHDPQKFMSWLADPASREEATKLGFFKVADVPRDSGGVDPKS